MKKAIKAITGLTMASALFIGSITANNADSYNSLSMDDVSVNDSPEVISVTDDYLAIGSNYGIWVRE